MQRPGPFPLLGWFATLLLLLLPPAGAAEKKPAPTASPDLVALTAQARKSVAVIRQLSRDGQQEGVGAGVVISRDGLIATCLHVIGEARRVTVELNDGRKLEATEVFASDRKLDLAVLRVAASNLPALKLGDSDALQQGAPVIAIGNPLGLEHSVVQGLVSAKREFEGVEMIQLAIPIESGNSGGPLLDTRGRVQGLLSMKSAVTANLGFAVPAKALQTLLDHPNPVPMNRWLTLGTLHPREWTPILGARWSRKAGRIQVESQGSGFGGRSLCLSQLPVPEPPYELTVTVKLDDESGAAGLAFASDGGDRHYGFYPTAGQLRLTRFDGPNVFSWNILKEAKTPHYRPGEWNVLGVRVEANRLLGFVNGQQVLESTDDAWRAGKVGLAKFRDTKAEFKNFQIGPNVLARATAPLPQDERARLLARASQLEKEVQSLRREAATAHQRQITSALLQTLTGPEASQDLLQAALLVARLDNPELEIETYRAEFTGLVAELQSRVAGVQSETGRVAALTRFLFTEQGFHGSRTDYHNRANSYLSSVLDDREGLPITLAVLYLELARNLGLTNVVGLPLPTHFMVAHRSASGPERIIDVFDGGRTMTRGEAVELVADNAGRIREEDFAPATKRAITVRLLRNLLGLAQRGGPAEDQLRYLNVILALDPESPGDRLARARAHLQRGASAEARPDLQWLIDTAPEGVDAERVAELLRSL